MPIPRHPGLRSGPVSAASATRRALLAATAALAAGLAMRARPAAARQEGDPEAIELLRRGAAAIAEADSFHFALTTPLGTTEVLNALELLAVEGDVQRPDRFRARIDARAAILDLSIVVIGIGDDLWVVDERTGRPYLEPEPSPAAGERGAGASGALAVLANPDLLFLAALSAIDDPQLGPDAEIDGEPVRRVDGTVDLARLAAGAVSPDDTIASGAATGAAVSTLPSDPLLVSVWLDAQDRPRRIELEGPLLDMEAPGIVRRLDLTRFDEPVTIEPPAGE